MSNSRRLGRSSCDTSHHPIVQLGSYKSLSFPTEVEKLVVLVSHGRNDILPRYQVNDAIQSVRRLLEDL